MHIIPKQFISEKKSWQCNYVIERWYYKIG